MNRLPVYDMNGLCPAGKIYSVFSCQGADGSGLGWFLLKTNSASAKNTSTMSIQSAKVVPMSRLGMERRVLICNLDAQYQPELAYLCAELLEI